MPKIQHNFFFSHRVLTCYDRKRKWQVYLITLTMTSLHSFMSEEATLTKLCSCGSKPMLILLIAWELFIKWKGLAAMKRRTRGMMWNTSKKKKKKKTWIFHDQLQSQRHEESPHTVAHKWFKKESHGDRLMWWSLGKCSAAIVTLVFSYHDIQYHIFREHTLDEDHMLSY